MTLENLAITKTNDLPIRHEGEVHNGKVRSVYWLKREDSERISNTFYGTSDRDLGVMVIGDRISAFECLWQSEGGLKGIPKKGASLNAVSKYWFDQFEAQGLTGNHIVHSPHPLVWIVQKAEPIMIEAIARQYITGSMWRAYERGERNFCGIQLPEGLQQNQRLDELLLTPSTKGILRGIPGVPEEDDVNITRKQIEDNYAAFGFKSVDDIDQYEALVREGFALIDRQLDSVGKVFVDTKFELGYLPDSSGKPVMVYIDEVGTPDSSRYWSKRPYVEEGRAEEESKEGFRQALLDNVPERDVLLNKGRMEERIGLAAAYRVPDKVFTDTSNLYSTLAEQITGQPIPEIKDARAEIVAALKPYGLIEA